MIITAVDSNRTMLKKALSPFYDLSFASSGTEALGLLKKQLPAGVVMDHSIEDFMTNAFIDKIRNSPVSRNLPFILVSRESSNSFVEQAVRAGVSHYIGIPFEPDALQQKIKSALDPKGPKSWKLYFRTPGEVESPAVSYGRVSFISATGIHFETRLHLPQGQKIQLSSPLLKDMGIEGTEIEVESVGSDVYYNYPYAIDAKWCDEELQKRMKGWIGLHKNLNSPKKRKVVVLEKDPVQVEALAKMLDATKYSLRVVGNIREALDSLPYMKPACFAVSDDVWKTSGAQGDQILALLTQFESKWILAGEDKDLNPKATMKPFLAPKSLEGIAAAIRNLAPPFPVDPDRIYFSKTLDYSRCNLHFNVKTLILGEMGVRLALPFEISLPCNLQLGLKIFSEQNLRNPYVRVWPPLDKISPAESNEGKYAWAAETHFLGINDQQGQAIRLWLRDKELEGKRSELYKPPAREGQKEAPKDSKPKK